MPIQKTNCYEKNLQTFFPGYKNKEKPHCREVLVF